MNFVGTRCKQDRAPLPRNKQGCNGSAMSKHLLMETRHVAIAVVSFLSLAVPSMSQNVGPSIRVDVDLVQLNVAVTDKHGNYVTGLNPRDFVILEDRLPQKLASFAEGDAPVRTVSEASPANGGDGTSPMAGVNTAISGANVFILFDKSNYMYRGFVFAQDAIADFIRSLPDSNHVAFYTYSRDLTRNVELTTDRSSVLRAMRASPAGDNAALYNALLLTLKDAQHCSGRKVVVVFSNGPDNASMVAPEDASELAQLEGVSLYMISTREAELDPVSKVVFERISAATGGKAYFAKSWKEEQKAFESIRQDLEHLYSLSYYPQPNPNRGWRSITVKVAGQAGKTYHIRTRSGYRPMPTGLHSETAETR